MEARPLEDELEGEMTLLTGRENRDAYIYYNSIVMFCTSVRPCLQLKDESPDYAGEDGGVT